MVGNVKVMAGSKAFDLFESKDVIDHRKAKTLIDFCIKCEKANYNYDVVTKLRQEYSDVI